MPKTDLLKSTDGQHLTWWCPGCEDFHGVPVVTADRQPGRAWGWNGDREKPTLQPSVFVNSPANQHHVPSLPSCHVYLVEGVIQFLGDCTHRLAGQNVPLVEREDETEATTMATIETRPTRLERVTITGADDMVNPRDLVALANTFPFVEFGILFSATRSFDNAPRYPCRRWLTRLAALGQDAERLHLSAHLCGRYMRDAMMGSMSWWTDFLELVPLFDRIQINRGGEVLDLPAMRDLRQLSGVSEIIIQSREFQEDPGLMKLIGPGFVPLFDRSGGCGELPPEWPVGTGARWPYGIPEARACGYAGGLNPDNMREEIPRILSAAAAGGCTRVWIDLETGVRTSADQFDVELAAAALEIAALFVAS
jgi:hypothetical protein